MRRETKPTPFLVDTIVHVEGVVGGSSRAASEAESARAQAVGTQARLCDGGIAGGGFTRGHADARLVCFSLRSAGAFLGHRTRRGAGETRRKTISA